MSKKYLIKELNKDFCYRNSKNKYRSEEAYYALGNIGMIDFIRIDENLCFSFINGGNTKAFSTNVYFVFPYSMPNIAGCEYDIKIQPIDGPIVVMRNKPYDPEQSAGDLELDNITLSNVETVKKFLFATLEEAEAAKKEWEQVIEEHKKSMDK